MKNILEAPFLVEMIRTTVYMYDRGWDERNGGNISLLLSEDEVTEYLDVNAVIREIPTGFDAPTLDGKYFIHRSVPGWRERTALDAVRYQ